MGASRPPNAPLLLDHRGGAQGVPAAGRRAGAVPRLGDRLGDADQARDLRGSQRGRGGEQRLRVRRRRRLARRGLGLLLRAPRLARVGGRLRPRGGVRRLSGGRRLAALALDPGRPGRGHRARARARAAPPAPGRVPRPGERRRAADDVRDRGPGDAGHPGARLPAASGAARSPGSPTACSSARQMRALASRASLDRASSSRSEELAGQHERALRRYSGGLAPL